MNITKNIKVLDADAVHSGLPDWCLELEAHKGKFCAPFGSLSWLSVRLTGGWGGGGVQILVESIVIPF